jgi:membrane associated rhomboid family serine protease
MLLPLGLGRRIPGIPWVTLGLATLTAAVSVANLGNLELLHGKLGPSTENRVLSGLREKVIRECCGTNRLEPRSCELLVKAGTGRLARRDQRRERDTFRLEDLTPHLRKVVRMGALDSPFRHESSWAEFDRIHSLRKRQAISFADEAGFLTRAGANWVALGLAQPYPGGWGHLVGNLVFLSLFGFYLECRIRPWAYLLLYAAGGTIGLGVQLALLESEHLPLMGASANVAFVIGVFAFLFQAARLRFLLLTFAVGFAHRVSLPALFGVPVFILAQDVVGALQGVGGGLGGGGVAHIAHLTGFAVGAGFGLLLRRMSPLPKGVLYRVEFEWPIEFEWPGRMKRTSLVSEKVALARKILRINPDHVAALEEARGSDPCRKEGSLVAIRRSTPTSSVIIWIWISTMRTPSPGTSCRR